MKEMVKIFNKNKVAFNYFIKRDWIPLKGIYFWIINVWVIDKNKNILIQKRSSSKKLFPNFFECVAGVVIKDESLIDAAIRELKEELNFEYINEKNIFAINESISFNPSYFCKTFIYVVDKINLNQINFNNNEISLIEKVNFNELNKLINNKLFSPDICKRFNSYLFEFKKIINNI